MILAMSLLVVTTGRLVGFCRSADSLRDGRLIADPLQSPSKTGLLRRIIVREDSMESSTNNKSLIILQALLRFAVCSAGLLGRLLVR